MPTDKIRFVMKLLREDRIFAVIVVLVFLILGSLLPASFGSSSSNNPSLPSGCSWIKVAGPTPRLTPVILLNSPIGSGAWASASASVSYTTAFNFVGYTSSESVSGWGIDPNNGGNTISGGAEGVFEVDNWDMYRLACPGSTQYIPEVVGQTGNFCTYNLMPQNSQSDANEPTQISTCGYTSINFFNGYNGKSGSVDTCNQGGTYFKTQTQSVNGWSLSVSIGTYASVSGSASITSGQSKSFYYNFPGNGLWYYQNLNGGGSGWSFYGAGCGTGGHCPPNCASPSPFRARTES